jgi:tetratricopeptide (TPR) repeat protein
MRLGRVLVVSVVAATAPLAGSAWAAAGPKDAKTCLQSSVAADKIAACTRLLGDSRLLPKERPVVLQARGRAYTTATQFDSAIADFTTLIAIRPNDAEAYVSRCLAHQGKGDFEHAIRDCNESIKLNPKVGANYAVRALCWKEQGDFDRALADLDIAVRLSPREYEIWQLRGATWRSKGEFDRAIADYGRAIELGPKEGMLYSYRGEAWRLKGDLDRALADQDQAIRVSPSKYPISYIQRGDTLRYRGELQRALADYDQTLRLKDGTDVAALTGRGLTYEKMGNLEQARAEFKKALAVSDQRNFDTFKSARETAAARLAALDSGAVQPTIPAAPVKSTSAIPTPAVSVPAAAPAAIKQGPRVALVIGNSAYKNVPALTNPPRDAEKVAASLRAIGFTSVTLANDASREKLADAFRKFANEAEKADWAVVYYAGHGMEVNGINYLIPVDAKLAVDRDVQFEAVPLEQVMASVEGAKKLRLVLLDACRDNPFTPQMRRTAAPDAVAASTAGGSIGTRSIGRGLGEVKVSGATLVVYAAKHGQTALDGEGGNSPFAVAVVQRIATPNVEINKVFRLVRDDVMEATAGRQEPYVYGSLPGRDDFYFVAGQ